MFGVRRMGRWFGTGFALAIFVISAPSTGADDYVLRARVDEAFEFDGSLYPPGDLSVRRVFEYNPSSGADEIRVGRRTLGLYLTRLTPTEAGSSDPTFVFVRGGSGRLVLVGWSLVGDEGRHWLHRVAGEADATLRAENAGVVELRLLASTR